MQNLTKCLTKLHHLDIYTDVPIDEIFSCKNKTYMQHLNELVHLYTYYHMLPTVQITSTNKLLSKQNIRKKLNNSEEQGRIKRKVHIL